MTYNRECQDTVNKKKEYKKFRLFQTIFLVTTLQQVNNMSYLKKDYSDKRDIISLSFTIPHSLRFKVTNQFMMKNPQHNISTDQQFQMKKEHAFKSVKFSIFNIQ